MTKTQLNTLIDLGVKTSKDLEKLNLLDTTITYYKNKLGRDLSEEELLFCKELNKTQVFFALMEAKRVLDDKLKNYKCYKCKSEEIADRGLCKKCLLEQK
jgi:hypothetical protein